MRRLRALLRRWLAPAEPTPAVPATHALSHCELGLHRDTIETAGGYMLRRRCLDCAHTEPIGWVYAGASNRAQPHHPWEADDA